MNISMSERFAPFSHLPGTEVLVPNSDWVIRVFPTLIEGPGFQQTICSNGPVKDFTVQSDFEKGCVWVWGKGPDAHFRFQIFADSTGLKMRLKKEETLLAKGGHVIENRSCERLFLGCHKAQDVDLPKRRIDSREIAPMLFLLGQKSVGEMAQIEFDLTNFEESFSNFYLSSFLGLFSPQTKDLHHLGIARKNTSGNLIRGAYAAIRSLLIHEEKILPHLPPNWISGKMVHVQSPYGLIDFEWSRGQIRRLLLRAEKAAPFQFGKEVRSFRVRKIKTQILYDNFER
jgi:hypothetical protein